MTESPKMPTDSEIRKAIAMLSCFDCLHSELCHRIPGPCPQFLGTCRTCIFGDKFEKHADIDKSHYLHCTDWHGDEQRIWHKYKRYEKVYSVVNRNGFCDHYLPYTLNWRDYDGDE
jgi:hypothetical protein